MIPVEQFVAHAEQHRARTGRPLVTLSYAQSIDGSIAARRGQRLGLSCQESLALSHRLRALHDALLVGIGTIMADDPCLNVRLVKGKDPRPVILDSRLRILLSANSLQNTLKPWIITTADADYEKQQSLEEKGIRILRMESNKYGLIDLQTMLQRLAAEGIISLLVEGGARVITSFIFERLIDQFVIYIAPTIIGGLHAVERLLVPELGEKPDAREFPAARLKGYERLGKDLVIWGEMVWKGY
jgi:3,4-dihydroxy 2-butanone 4-phosphate synthase/GTP cyclohydrolase II